MSTLSRRVGWLSLAACLPIVIALVRFAPRGTLLDGDEAVFAMQTADAATGGFPTTGLYSWNGWNHPGPIAFYLFAPFHWISGGAVWGTLLGAGMWSAATMMLTGWLSARRGGIVLTTAALAAQSLTWVAVGGVGVIDPWTPNLAVSLVVPFLLAAWGLAERDRSAGVAAIMVGLLAPQIHVGYLALFGGIGVVALALAIGRAAASVPWRAWCLAAGVGALTWLPVVVDMAMRRTGNLSALLRYFRSGTPRPAGIREGVAIVAGEASPWPTWLTGPRPQGLFLEARQAGAGWWLAAAAVLVATAWRTRRRGVMIALAAFVTATIAASQLRGSRFHYLVYWRAPVLLFAALVVGHAWSSDRRPRSDSSVRRAAGGVERVAVAGIGVMSLALATWSAARADQVTRYADVLADVAPQARRAVPADGRVVLRLGDGGVVGLLPGVLHDLDIHGVDVRVDRDLEWVVGDRGADSDAASEIWYVTDNGWSFAALSRLPGARVIAVRDVAPATGEEFAATAVRVVEQLRAAGRIDLARALDSPLVGLALADVPGVDQALVARLAELNTGAAPGDRVGIVAFARDAAPIIDWPVTAL